MNLIKYKYQSQGDSSGQFFIEKMMPYNDTNEETAKREAYNGEYTIEDDGQPEPAPTETEILQAQIDALTIALLEG